MIDYFSISEEGVRPLMNKGNWIAVSNPTLEEKEQLHDLFELPKNFFSLNENYSDVSFLKTIRQKTKKTLFDAFHRYSIN